MSGLFGGVFFSSIIRLVGAAELVAVVLQLALAGLVAHRAVERVVEQQAFERLRLGVPSPSSLLVTMTVPSLAGVWQAGTTRGCMATVPSGFFSPTSTRHIRQLATTVSAGCQQ